MTCAKCGGALTAGSRFCGTCGNAVQSTETAHTGVDPGAVAHPDLVGREIGGRYRILAKLGEGGMGAVYRAEQISLKRKVAVKCLRPELSSQPGLVRRFNAEAELAAKLNHPNTVDIYDFGQDADGTLFIAMEYVEGKSLRQVIATEGALPPARALHIVAQIASSLTDAHGHGIVHRDLKPDNVMLTERGRHKDVVRVLDFGIAKLRDDSQDGQQAMTRAGDLVGTPQYMAPEQIRAEPVDGRTDVYAVGAMLFEMLTSRLPFEGPTLMAILSKHLVEEVEPPSRRRPDLAIPPALDRLVLETLAKRADDRTPSMERLGERIAEIAVALGAPVAFAPMTGPSTAQVPVGAPSMSPPPGPPPGTPPPPGPAPMTPSALAAQGYPSGAPPSPRKTPGAFRPPGVPHTYPPGVMVAPDLPPPPTPPPPQYASYQQQHLPPPLPSGTPPPPTYAQTAQVAKSGGSNRVIIAIAALALVGAGVGVAFYVLNKDDTGGGTGSGAAAQIPVPAGGDPWAGTGQGTDPSEAPDPSDLAGAIDPWASGGTRVQTPGGTELYVPQGMIAAPSSLTMPGAFIQGFAGTYNGARVRLAIIEFGRTGEVDGLTVLQGALANTTAQSANTRVISGRAFQTSIADSAEDDGMYRYEHLLIHDPQRALLVSVGTAPESFDDSEPLRERIFVGRFRY